MSLGYAQAQTTYNADSYNLSSSGGNFTNGNGDSASFTTVNSEINSWWGLGIKSSCCNSYSGYGIVFDARTGSMFTQGNIGVGTATPIEKLEVNGNVKAGGLIASDPNYPAIRASLNGSSLPSLNFTRWTGTASIQHNAFVGQFINSSLGEYDLGIGTGVSSSGNQSATSNAIIVTLAGNVGIGTPVPAANLDVQGNIKLSGGGAHLVFPDGSTQSVPWNGTTCGGDYAESVDIVGDRKSYEPGDVLVIDAKIEGSFVKSTEPYSTAVMGIYSTKPGLTGRRQLTAKSEEEIPMAMIGIVPTKVTTENGPIKPGDLLVTSSTPGYAMKGTDKSKMMGAVIGKAMGHLDSGKGVIEAGVTLQ